MHLDQFEAVEVTIEQPRHQGVVADQDEPASGKQLQSLEIRRSIHLLRGAGRDELLELFELTRWRDELVESFSHGMKQRLVMCAAFLHRPRAVGG